MTHIRDDAKTFDPYHGLPGIYWQALCGVERPPSSISERHAKEVVAGHIQPAAAPMCQRCVAFMALLVTPQTEP